MSRKTFGQMFYEIRAKHRIPFRDFCLSGGFDPVEVSKIERDEIVPPKKIDSLARYAHALKIVKGSQDWQRFFALAAQAKGRTCPMTKAELLEKVPVVFRTTKGRKVASHTLNALVEKIASS